MLLEENVGSKEIRIEDELVIMPANQAFPESNEQKPEKSENSVSNHQISKSCSSMQSLSGLEVDEGDDKVPPLKLFFEDLE